MITLLREEYTPTINHLETIDTIEEILKIRDYVKTSDLYETDVLSRSLRLNQQFNTGGDEVSFYQAVATKLKNDSVLNFDNLAISTMFDESLLKRNQSVTYVHFNLKSNFTKAELITAVQTLLTKINSSHNVLHFYIRHKIEDYRSQMTEAYNHSVSQLNDDLTRSTKVSVVIYTLETYNDSGGYDKFYYPLSAKENNVYLLNKILTARKTLIDMARVRGYQGESRYVYYDNFSGRFGHFKMNLQARLDLARATGPSNSLMPLESQNYFDVPLFGSKQPSVYIHFLLLSVSDYPEYCKSRETQIRNLLKISADQHLHLILVVNKKQGTKTLIEKIGDRLSKHFTLDIILLDNLLFNPLANVNQPKFRLIKKRDEKYQSIVEHYGSTDDIPKISLRDPVNKFYGGEPNDIYEIIRPGSIKINDEKDTMLHIDVAYRIVKVIGHINSSAAATAAD